jgi:site-specific DNA-methyltransferase (adenine-specific)
MADERRIEYLNTIAHMDIFDLCDCLDDNSVDMILSDLPYGITACEWDTVIPFEPMWECFKRIIKPRGAIVLTASGKFTYQLVMSNFDMFKYEWIWDKYTATGGATSKYMPMKSHEIILLFSDGMTIYNPQMVDFTEAEKKRMRKHDFVCNGAAVGGSVHTSTGWFDGKQKHPKSVIRINGLTPVSKEKQTGQHPTQKPVALFEYLIRTYTQPGEVVFDPCVGSGTTALAALHDANV